MMDHQVAIVILAAGTSSRLGRPKQLEIVHDKSLLNHTIDIALATSIEKIVVVLGARFDEIKEHIKGKNVTCVENKSWSLGLSTSIIYGLDWILENNLNINKIIFMVCDQPYIHNELLTSLINTQIKTQLPIVASEYSGIKGIPALFDKSMFGLLKELTGDSGAGKIIKKYPNLVASVPFEKGVVDIDCDEDLTKLNQ
jgi:molybdenum cofactor cytidylyltransferase